MLGAISHTLTFGVYKSHACARPSIAGSPAYFSNRRYFMAFEDPTSDEMASIMFQYASSGNYVFYLTCQQSCFISLCLN